MSRHQTEDQKLIISNSDYIHIVNHQEIIYCQSDGCYTHINLINGQKYTVAKSLVQICKQINASKFIRISQSYLINSSFITKIARRNKNLYLLDLVLPFTISLKDLMQHINTKYELLNETDNN